MSDESPTPPDYSDLTALFFNCTLTRSPEPSHTQVLIDKSRAIMEGAGVETESLRFVDLDVATGVYPDMREHGWERDEWPEIAKKVQSADIVVIAGPIWLGDNSSITKKLVERLYSNSAELNSLGQSANYGKVAGCLIDGNEDGVKHCAMNLLYSMQHIGFTIPPQADAGWIGEIGPGPSYGDDAGDGTRVGFENDFTNRNVTIMSWNLMHLSHILKAAGGYPAYGNDRTAWENGARFGFESNPEYRQGSMS